MTAICSRSTPSDRLEVATDYQPLLVVGDVEFLDVRSVLESGSRDRQIERGKGGAGRQINGRRVAALGTPLIHWNRPPTTRASLIKAMSFTVLTRICDEGRIDRAVDRRQFGEVLAGHAVDRVELAADVHPCAVVRECDTLNREVRTLTFYLRVKRRIDLAGGHIELEEVGLRELGSVGRCVPDGRKRAADDDVIAVGVDCVDTTVHDSGFVEEGIVIDDYVLHRGCGRHDRECCRHHRQCHGRQQPEACNPKCHMNPSVNRQRRSTIAFHRSISARSNPITGSGLGVRVSVAPSALSAPSAAE